MRLPVTGGVGLEDLLNLVTNTAEGIHLGFAFAYRMGWIFKAPMEAVDFPWKSRTGLVCVTADGDYGVDPGIQKLVEMF